MKKYLLPFLYLLLVFAMFAMAARTVLRAQEALEDGKTYRMRISGYDPVDLFRGRYLLFSMPDTAGARSDKLPPRARRGYVSLRDGADGFAVFGMLSPRPERHTDSIEVRIPHWSYQSGNRFSAPFSRYYVNERQAEKAEKLFLEAARRREAVLLFRVKDGFAVIEDIELGGRPLRKLLAESADTL